MSRDKLSLDELRDASLALRELISQDHAIDSSRPADQDQIDALTGDQNGPAVYDLTAIWRAAKEDAGIRNAPNWQRYMSPRRYVNGWPHMVDALETSPDGRLLADRNAAYSYCQQVDQRVMAAVIDHMIATRKEHARRDPIGNAVHSARGGPFGMMFAREDARHLGLTDDEFADAVLGRAREMAEDMDDYEAEKLLSQVRQAIEGSPKMEVMRPGPDAA